MVGLAFHQPEIPAARATRLKGVADACESMDCHGLREWSPHFSAAQTKLRACCPRKLLVRLSPELAQARAGKHPNYGTVGAQSVDIVSVSAHASARDRAARLIASPTLLISEIRS